MDKLPDHQVFEFTLRWEIASVGVLKPSAMRFALEKLFQKAKVAGKVIITEVREIDVISKKGIEVKETDSVRTELRENPDEFNRLHKGPSKKGSH